MSSDTDKNLAAEYERQRQLDDVKFNEACNRRHEIMQRVLGYRDLFAQKLVNGRAVIDKPASRKRVQEVMEAFAREGGTTMVIPRDEQPVEDDMMTLTRPAVTWDEVIRSLVMEGFYTFVAVSDERSCE